jgi:hypothetical protein
VLLLVLSRVHCNLTPAQGWVILQGRGSVHFSVLIPESRFFFGLVKTILGHALPYPLHSQHAPPAPGISGIPGRLCMSHCITHGDLGAAQRMFAIGDAEGRWRLIWSVLPGSQCRL